ncbi:hypothetical protein SERLADRAFT_402552, partial [Serpula lacrymans var. lacrymans S7.9]
AAALVGRLNSHGMRPGTDVMRWLQHCFMVTSVTGGVSMVENGILAISLQEQQANTNKQKHIVFTLITAGALCIFGGLT